MWGIEYNRKIVHTFTGIFAVILLSYHIIDYKFLVGSLIAMTFVGIVLKFWKIPGIWKIYELTERKKNLERFPGLQGILYLVGMVLVLVLSGDSGVAYAAVMILALGDTFAWLVGTRFGRVENILDPSKTAEGSIAGGLAAALGAAFFVSPGIAIAGAASGMLMEALSTKAKVEDNLTVPVVSAIVMKILLMWF